MDVFVRLPNGRVRPFTVRPEDRLSALAAVLAANEGISADKVRISYEGKPLDQDKAFRQYGIVRETLLQAAVVEPRLLDIVIKGSDGRAEAFTVRSSTSLAGLIADVAHRFKVDTVANRVVLRERVHNRELPATDNTLDSWGIEAESVLELELRANKGKARDAGSSNSDAAAVKAPPMDKAREEEILRNFVQSATTKKVEIVVSFDTTGSMSSCLAEVRRQVAETVARLCSDIKDIRIGIMAHGDYCDGKNALRTMDLSRDQPAICRFVETVPSTGGGDAPECYELVLRRARDLSWTADAAKALVVIGDAVPHPPSYTDQNIDWNEELEALAAMDVKVYGVRAMNSPEAQPFYEALATRTNAINIDFQDFRVMTDMFLAVCYKEAGDAHFEAFAMEVQDQGRLVGELGNVLNTLRGDKKDSAEAHSPSEAAKPARKRAPQVSALWWSRDQDNGHCAYHYNKSNDGWDPCPGHGSAARSARTASIKRTHTPAETTKTEVPRAAPVVVDTGAGSKKRSARKSAARAVRRSCVVS